MKNFIGLLIGLSMALLLTLFAGENPFYIFSILFKSSFGSNYDFGLTLSYAVPLIFCALSVSTAFHAGLFNIGAEGQLTMAAITAALTGVLLPNIPFPFSIIFGLTLSVIVAGFWGLIVGALKAYRSSHEVIVTIMLNFIASGVANWITLQVIPNPNSQNPETAVVSTNYFLPPWDPIAKIFPDTPANISILVALLLCFMLWGFLYKTTWGFRVRAVGYNIDAARRAGISEKKVQMFVMFFAGCMAGFVALSEVFGSTGQFKIGFSPDYGFMAIAVSLLARNHPLGIIPSAFLMAALHKGASDLDFETESITRDFSKIMQAFIILGVSAQALYEKLWPLFKKERKK